VGTRKIVFAVLVIAASQSTPAAFAQFDTSDGAALRDLEQFLNSPQQRAAFSQGNSQATQANNFLNAFPAWVQQEIIDINMAIMRENSAGAMQHHQAMMNGGVPGAMASFSPAVRSRVQALVSRLEADPSFNNAANLGMLKMMMPMFLVSPGI